MLAARILAGLIGAALAYQSFFYFNVVLHGFDVIAFGLGAVPLLPALFLLWFAFFGDDPLERRRIGWTLLIGLVIGVVSFLAGFAGPMVFTPGANQGPLLGIFITGPFGFLAGCVIGFLWTRFRM